MSPLYNSPANLAGDQIFSTMSGRVIINVVFSPFFEVSMLPYNLVLGPTDA